ncbi:hypothetical protein F5B20DRAFT_585056 [Whalleya microplaca]|nr:hypothetical protein F5B20DRAFT_585056 [Whalleya microplaca]
MSQLMTNTHGVVLDPRYQIRRVDPSVGDWAKAMGVEGFLLRDATLWKPILPAPKTANALKGFRKLSGHYNHSIMSGHSYAIFDTQYRYRRTQSAAYGGMLYWDELDPRESGFEKHGRRKMLERMDFPMVCIAFAFDAFAPRSESATAKMLDLLPLQSQLGAFLASMDPRPMETWAPTDYGQVLIRSGCVTRPGYEGQGLATALNQFVMLEAKWRGFYGINVGMGNASIYRSYMNPPPGVRSEVLSYWDFEEIELVDKRGRKIRPYVGSGMKEGWYIWCDLTDQTYLYTNTMQPLISQYGA